MAVRAKATHQTPRQPRALEPAAPEAARVRTVLHRRGRSTPTGVATAHAATRPVEA